MPPNLTPRRIIKLIVTKQVYESLERIRDAGMYGRSVSAVSSQLVAEKAREVLREQAKP